jgi:hypothetical protein
MGETESLERPLRDGHFENGRDRGLCVSIEAAFGTWALVGVPSIPSGLGRVIMSDASFGPPLIRRVMSRK